MDLGIRPIFTLPDLFPSVESEPILNCHQLRGHLCVRSCSMLTSYSRMRFGGLVWPSDRLLACLALQDRGVAREEEANGNPTF